MLLLKPQRQPRKLVALLQHRPGQQGMQQMQQFALQLFRQQQLELVLQSGKQGGVLRRQGQLQLRQSGQQAAALPVHGQEV